MSRAVTVNEAAALLSAAEDIVILLHQYPDGDAIGSGYALALALQALGKRVRPICCDAVPEKYSYITGGVQFPEFTPRFVCTVDVADPKLLGSLSEQWPRVDLAIDHHGTNVGYAEALLLDAAAGAAAMPIREVIAALGVELDRRLAECLYTGLSTDTGCFKYANTTPETHLLAAELMGHGVRHAMINERMYDSRSRARMELERMALDSMRYFFDGRCAVMTITAEMVKTSGAAESDMDGFASLPRQIEGVWVGVTLREKADGSFKASIRTREGVNAAEIAATLGGGGHFGAAGCTVCGTADQAVDAILSAVAPIM